MGTAQLGSTPFWLEWAPPVPAESLRLSLASPSPRLSEACACRPRLASAVTFSFILTLVFSHDVMSCSTRVYSQLVRQGPEAWAGCPWQRGPGLRPRGPQHPPAFPGALPLPPTPWGQGQPVGPLPGRAWALTGRESSWGLRLQAPPPSRACGSPSGGLVRGWAGASGHCARGAPVGHRPVTAVR